MEDNPQLINTYNICKENPSSENLQSLYNNLTQNIKDTCSKVFPEIKFKKYKEKIKRADKDFKIKKWKKLKNKLIDIKKTLTKNEKNQQVTEINEFHKNSLQYKKVRKNYELQNKSEKKQTYQNPGGEYYQIRKSRPEKIL